MFFRLIKNINVKLACAQKRKGTQRVIINPFIAVNVPYYYHFENHEKCATRGRFAAYEILFSLSGKRVLLR